jgi:hypothetical protein
MWVVLGMGRDEGRTVVDGKYAIGGSSGRGANGSSQVSHILIWRPTTYSDMTHPQRVGRKSIMAQVLFP